MEQLRYISPVGSAAAHEPQLSKLYIVEISLGSKSVLIIAIYSFVKSFESSEGLKIMDYESLPSLAFHFTTQEANFVIVQGCGW